MLINTYIQSVGDQVGGSFKQLPPTLVHVPRLQGAFFTLPSGLIITSERKFEWSLVPPIPNGVVSLTNVFSETPTIEFDPQAYSGGDLKIKCSIRGQPNNFAIYTLFTVLTSLFTGGDLIVAEELFIPEYSISNLAYSFSGISGTVGPITNFTPNLVWQAPSLKDNLINYLVENWDPVSNNWIFNTYTTNTYLNNVNLNNTYRVKPIFPAYINVNSVEFKYTPNISTEDTLILGIDSYNIAIDTNLNSIYVENTQVVGNPAFFASIEPSLQEDLFFSFVDTNLNDGLISSIQIENTNPFFTQVELINYDTDLFYIYNDNTLNDSLILHSQLENTAIFWAEQTGA